MQVRNQRDPLAVSGWKGCSDGLPLFVSCRPHGGEGTFTELSTPCIGYNQLSVLLDTIKHGKDYFLSLPDRPQKLKAYAKEVTFVCRYVCLLAAPICLCGG